MRALRVFACAFASVIDVSGARVPLVPRMTPPRNHLPYPPTSGRVVANSASTTGILGQNCRLAGFATGAIATIVRRTRKVSCLAGAAEKLAKDLDDDALVQAGLRGLLCGGENRIAEKLAETQSQMLSLQLQTAKAQKAAAHKTTVAAAANLAENRMAQKLAKTQGQMFSLELQKAKAQKAAADETAAAAAAKMLFFLVNSQQGERLEQSCARAEALAQQFNTEKARAEEAERSLETAQAEIAQLQEQLEDSQAEVGKRRAEVYQLQLFLNEMSEAKKEMVEQVSKLQQSYSNITDELEQSQIEVELRESEIARLSADLKATVSTLDLVEAQLTNAMMLLESAENQLSTIRGSLRSALRVFVYRVKKRGLALRNLKLLKAAGGRMSTIRAALGSATDGFVDRVKKRGQALRNTKVLEDVGVRMSTIRGSLGSATDGFVDRVKKQGVSLKDGLNHWRLKLLDRLN